MFKLIKKFIDDNELWDAEFFLAALGTNIAVVLTIFLKLSEEAARKIFQ